MAEPAAAGQQALAGLGKSLAGIAAEDGGGEGGNVELAQAELAAEGRFKTEREVVEALGRAAQQRGDARLGAAGGQAGEALAALQELEADGAIETVGLIGEVVGDLVLRFGDELGGGRRGGSAERSEE